MRDHDGVLSFTPRLPEALTRLTFRLCWRGRRLLVEVTRERATYSVLKGSAMEIVHHGAKATVEDGAPLIRPIPRPHAGASPSQPPGRAPRRRRPAR
jgi:alpha,alpha-trehalose phosphorylase